MEFQLCQIQNDSLVAIFDFLFPHFNLSLALNVKSKILYRITWVYE